MISAPFSVMRMVCSNWAHRPRSLVTTVQLSRHVSQRMPPCGVGWGSRLGEAWGRGPGGIWVRMDVAASGGCKRASVPRGVQLRRGRRPLAGAGLTAGDHTPYPELAKSGRQVTCGYTGSGCADTSASLCATHNALLGCPPVRMPAVPTQNPAPIPSSLTPPIPGPTTPTLPPARSWARW